MVTKSKLKMALAAEKGTDFKKLKQERKRKKALKQQKAQRVAEQEEDKVEEEAEGEEEESDNDYEEEEYEKYGGMNLQGIDDSDSSDSSVDMEERLPRKPKKTETAPAKKTPAKKSNGKAAPMATEDDEKDEEDEEEEEEEEEDEEDIPISDLEDLDDEDKEDLIPHTRLTINNTSALLAALTRIGIPTDSSVPFATHQTVMSAEPTAASIPDVSDDLQRELAFYTQSLEAVRKGRTKLLSEGVPFSRPKDYFAEMVKEDAHMDRVKAKLVEEASAKKASAEARKQRELKKYGKQVQVAKLQERQKAKKETLDKIKTLKRKRQESGSNDKTNETDLFDVGVNKELAKYGNKSSAGNRSGAGRGNIGGASGNPKRQKKNEKYGFGGKKRHSKSGDATSSSDLSGFNAKKMKAGSGKGRVTKASASRPGKDRRNAMARR
ncbi:rRNA-processing protein EBP2 [Geosmithia morbida]|uniref:rRNA-processing protein EBP2 n=1 Tax=Geosmithia morbida TaxID=1094350 RepID=A0A9P4YQG5_9HYPO|nr:rRNA-processing protein EBP2 [Geosmithia morbida]KAF4120145.1 rRNA-processing protein EBP2 [Geosmithia morbida]